MPRTIERTREEVAEIERHKYFLSENAGYDVGWEAAEKDWDEHHEDHFSFVINRNGISSIFEHLSEVGKL